MTYYDLPKDIQDTYSALDKESKQYPLEEDGRVLRFKRNVVTVWVADCPDLSQLWVHFAKRRWPIEDMMSFYRQLGCPLSGFVAVFSEYLDRKTKV